jgi:hypothetical protein
VQDSFVDECLTTGGHWDPSFACGPASEFGGTTCKGMNYAADYDVRCVDAEMQNGCEYGDISGKVGTIDLKMAKQKFEDNFMKTPVANFLTTRFMFPLHRSI